MANSLRKRIGEITQPTLIFHPRHDDQSDISNAFTLQRGLSGPTEMIVLEDSYHLVTLDRQRALVASRSTAFVARLSEEDIARDEANAPQRSKGAAE